MNECVCRIWQQEAKWRHFHDKVCEMKAIVCVDGSRWSRCCNINSSVSTCWNTAAAFLQATALPPIHRLDVAGIFFGLLQQLTLSPRLFSNDIHIYTLLCHKPIFYGDHFLLDHILCQDSEVVGIYHPVEGCDLNYNPVKYTPGLWKHWITLHTDI